MFPRGALVRILVVALIVWGWSPPARAQDTGAGPPPPRSLLLSSPSPPSSTIGSFQPTPPPLPPLPAPPPPRPSLATLSRRAVLVLIIVPEICAAGVVGCLIYRFIRARRLRREAAANGEPEEEDFEIDYGNSVKPSQVAPFGGGGGLAVAKGSSGAFQTQTAIIPAASLVIKEQIGFGASARVYRALWSGTTVAVKVWIETDASISRKVSGSLESKTNGAPVLLHFATQSGQTTVGSNFSQLTQFRSEVQLLSNLRHPNILQFYGLAPPLTLVMEFGTRGSLRTALDAAAAAKGEQAQPLSWRTRMAIAAGVAAGMEFLHEQVPSVIHRDLKPGNVILDVNFIPKVADFGLSIAETRLAGEAAVAVGTLRYMAPEIMELGASPVRLPTAIDVYAYGWLLCDLKGPTRRKGRKSQIAVGGAGDDMSVTQQQATTVGLFSAYERTRPSFDMERELAGLPEPLAQVARACTARLPEGRPPFPRLRGEMQELAESEADKWDAALLSMREEGGDDSDGEGDLTSPEERNRLATVHPAN